MTEKTFWIVLIIFFIIIGLDIYWMVSTYEDSNMKSNNFCKSQGFEGHKRDVNDYCYKDGIAKQILITDCGWSNNCKYFFVEVGK